MSIDAIADASVGLEEEYIPMVVSYIDFLKSYKAGNILSADDTTQQVFKPKDAMNIFANSLCYMADDFNDTPEEFKEYL